MNACRIFYNTNGIPGIFIENIDLCTMAHIDPIIDRTYFQVIPSSRTRNMKCFDDMYPG